MKSRITEIATESDISGSAMDIGNVAVEAAESFRVDTPQKERSPMDETPLHAAGPGAPKPPNPNIVVSHATKSVIHLSSVL